MCFHCTGTWHWHVRVLFVTSFSELVFRSFLSVLAANHLLYQAAALFFAEAFCSTPSILLRVRPSEKDDSFTYFSPGLYCGRASAEESEASAGSDFIFSSSRAVIFLVAVPVSPPGLRQANEESRGSFVWDSYGKL